MHRRVAAQNAAMNLRRLLHRLIAPCALLGLALPTLAAEPAPLPTVAQVDLARYAGAWYEIALLPNRFQKQCAADTQARYRLDGDRVEVINRCRLADGRVDDIKGRANVVEGSGNAKLRVSFFWPFYGDYWVLALDDDYRQVLVGAALQALLDRAAALGFDRTAFKRTPQTQPLD
jgi:apolipoprotein D and lipocalin family protein